ncbi:MAG: Na+/H+ antiporter NhaC [Deltaproteobacteria bacterium]|nr:Na+/H+ antiporter NhaC [Deltaproteobacteria bacterium]
MSDTPEHTRPIRPPSYVDAIAPLALLVALIAGGLSLYGLDALGGPIPAALVVCAMATGVIVLRNGHTWGEVEDAIKRAVGSVTSAIFILLAVGALIGTWNLSGTIPTLVSYGIRWIDPDFYYVSTAVICALTSLSIGSSWTTAGTVGVGLVGIASLLGVSPAITAGAVISGSYLGDKVSPLSETTVLASQLAGADLYTHIRAQVWTSVPAFLIGALVLAILGLSGEGVLPDEAAASADLTKLDQLYWISLWNLLPLLALLGMSLKKSPSALAILAASLFAGVQGILTQPEVFQRFVADPELATPLVYLKGIWSAMATGFEANSGLADVDRLLSRGGMDSMLGTIWLILGAVTFGTLLQEFGLIGKLVDPLIARAKSDGRLFATTAGMALGLNVVAADQYIALVLPVKTFKKVFAERGFAPQVLSRAAADAGTVTSPLVPWNSCGAFMAAVLGVPTLLYLPFCFFNILSPILTVLYGATGFQVARARPPGGTDR